MGSAALTYVFVRAVRRAGVAAVRIHGKDSDSLLSHTIVDYISSLSFDSDFCICPLHYGLFITLRFIVSVFDTK